MNHRSSRTVRQPTSAGPSRRRRPRRWQRLHRLVTLAVALLLLLPATVGNAAPDTSNRDRELTVMSRNLYLGASLTPLLVASGEAAVLEAVRTVWNQVGETDFPTRAEALADEIVDEAPLLIGLQEVTTYRSGPIGHPDPAEDVLLDFLDVLLGELAERGASYRVVASVENFDGELPYVDPAAGLAFDLRLTDRDVILVRADVPTSQLKVLDTAAGHFAAALPAEIGGQETAIVRGWVSADVKVRGQTFRFVNTHPEAFHPGVNAAQIGELLAGPLATALPVVLVGDLNATPGTPAMTTVFSAGFVDTALTAPTADAGPTCCFDDTVTGGELTSRIDYVLFRGPFEAVSQHRVGHLPGDRIDGRYPSDHAGVVAELIVPPGSNRPVAGAPGRR